jgi:hypothetical protein
MCTSEQVADMTGDADRAQDAYSKVFSLCPSNQGAQVLQAFARIKFKPTNLWFTGTNCESIVSIP